MTDKCSIKKIKLCTARKCAKAHKKERENKGKCRICSIKLNSIVRLPESSYILYSMYYAQTHAGAHTNTL